MTARLITAVDDEVTYDSGVDGPADDSGSLVAKVVQWVDGAPAPGHLPLALALDRTGTAWHQGTFDVLGAAEVATHPVLTARLPQWRPLPSGALLCGLTAGGEMMYRVGATHYLTDDGGETTMAVSPSMAIPAGSLRCDSAGNHYTTSGTSVYRAPAGTWTFALAFAFPVGSPPIFGFTEDGEGGVWFTEYYSAGDKRSKGVARSTDYGATWVVDSVDYGQRHHHGIHYHAPSGALYLVPGEPSFPGSGLEAESATAGGGRGFLRSWDRGATWEDVLGRGTPYQPLMGTTVGRYILWGQDAAPTGFVVLDTETDAVTYLRNHGTVGTSPFNAGFFYSQRLDLDGAIYAPAEANTSVDLIAGLTMVTDLDRPVNLWSPAVGRSVSHEQIYGPDNGGYFYCNVRGAASGGLADPVAFSRTTVVTSEAVLVASTPTGGDPAPVVVDWDNAVSIVAGETVNGVKVLRLGASAACRQTHTDLPASPGETLHFTFLARQRSAEGAYFRLRAQSYSAAGTVLATNTRQVDTTHLPATGAWVRVRTSITLSSDASVAGFRLDWFRDAGAAGTHDLDVASRVIVSRNAALDPAYAASVFSDSVTFSQPVDDSFLLRDRIYQLGRSDDWTVGQDHPLVTINTVEVGVRRTGTGFGAAAVYAKVGGVEALSVPAGQWGSTPDPTAVAATPHVLTAGNQLSRSHVVQAPIVVGAAPGKLLVIDSGRVETHEVNVGAAFDDNLAVELHGTAYHLPFVFDHVQVDYRDDVLRAT